MKLHWEIYKLTSKS